MTVLRRRADARLVAEPANELVLRTLLTRSDSAADLSVTWVRLDGHHRRLHTDASTRVYVVTEGTATFQVGEDPPVELCSGDLLAIPAGTHYELWGAVTYLVINQPGFRDGDDIYTG